MLNRGCKSDPVLGARGDIAGQPADRVKRVNEVEPFVWFNVPSKQCMLFKSNWAPTNMWDLEVAVPAKVLDVARNYPQTLVRTKLLAGLKEQLLTQAYSENLVSAAGKTPNVVNEWLQALHSLTKGANPRKNQLCCPAQI